MCKETEAIYNSGLVGKGYTEIVSIDGVDEVDWSAISVLTDGKGNYWVGTDCGCSCNRAFELYNGIDDFTGPMTLDQAKESVFEEVKNDRLVCSDYKLDDDQSVREFVEQQFGNTDATDAADTDDALVEEETGKQPQDGDGRQ